MNKKTGVKIAIGAAVLGAVGYGCYILGKRDMLEECNKACQRILDDYEYVCTFHTLDMVVMSNPKLGPELCNIVDEWDLNGYPDTIKTYWSLEKGGVFRWMENGNWRCFKH